VAGDLEHYIEARRVGRCALTPETPLIGSRHGGSRYTGQGVRHALNTLFKDSKVYKPNGRFPRIHDFRHSFAVNALLRWYRAGVDVQSRLPLLAAYMGHVSISSTVYYLHFIEPLRTLASARFAERYGSLITSEAISERSGA
jgi:integrase